MMFLEPNEANVALAMEYVMAGVGKLYGNERAAKVAEKMAAWEYKHEAEKAGWKFAAEPAEAAWVVH